jgi:hypothetical protein
VKLRGITVILAERVNSLFGQAGSQYDFGKLDIGQSKDRARELEEQQRGMKKKVNTKVMNMIDTCVPYSTLPHPLPPPSTNLSCSD